MTVCNHWDKHETSACRFTLPFTCNDCAVDESNYVDDDDSSDTITFINAYGKHIDINPDTKLDCIIEKPVDNIDYKETLLSSFIVKSNG